MSVITFRTDPETDDALAALTEDGRSQSAAIRDALLIAARQRDDERLRAEALVLASDPEDVAEARSVQADLESLRAW
jgi:Arc/MetJ-type ribon-helix-helix transcriptional regulator